MAKKTNPETTEPKINNTESTTKSNGKKVDAYERIIKIDVLPEQVGSSCHHGRGDDCSVDRRKLDRSEPPHISLNLDKAHLMRALKNMMQSRHTDEKHLTLVKQGKSYFHIGCSGHEATQTAIAFAMESGKDWGWTYYRDMAFSFGMGFSLRDYFLLALHKAEDPATGGRQMPGHYGHPRLNLPTQSSPTGTQFLNATGCALASKKLGTDEVTYVASGEGTTSQGEFYEAVNWATREKLPVMFHIQDNGYAISVPKADQSMGGSVVYSFCCYPNLLMKEYDGTDYFESVKAARDAVEYIRAGRGPALMHAVVERLLPHSSSDDHRKYRSEEELAAGKAKRDCIAILSDYMIQHELTTLDEIEALRAEVINEINEAIEWAEGRPDVVAEDSTKHVFADESTRMLDYATSEPKDGNPAVLVDAVNHAMMEEMRRNDKMVIFGEDVADPKGGVFTATRGLSNEYGEERVFNSPLAEASIVGVALGLAVRGFKPVIEIQFGDYIWPAFMQYKNEVATMRFRSNGGFKAPVVTRVAVGGYIHGGLCHSQNIEAIFAHIPGIMIAYPSNAADAKGLLKTACRLDDPVIFCEHKGMYRLPFARTIEPDENYLIPFGVGKTVKSGDSATIITYGMGVKDSVNAVKRFEKEFDKSIEIIDLRTIIPWDKELVLESVKRTGRVMIVHEDTMTAGFGAEISATISQNAFPWLDAPVMRLAAKDSHIPYAPVYEEDVLPNENKVLDMLKQLIAF
ncbi:MAG: dehydrogenase E1 component subunit alpha/beta [Desulfobulbaceae bacterium]|nr:dehydrogenase E1 component subunit alpha/beta [Candidatus Kapabacteria bacterium]MBS4001348.1 dehydrogenase E1 component subunit alpha/beta [Desulfobulbaceae bacterium]